MNYTVSPKNLIQNHNIIVVGCGGTGGFVAEGLCRLLIGDDTPIVLIDPDRVEPHNRLRQNFYDEDIDKFKAEVLANRLSRQYHRKIGYSVYPFQPDLMAEFSSNGLYKPIINGIIIGCVDRVPPRRTIAETLEPFNWWLDAGNGYSYGQVLFGNAKSISQLENSFNEETGEVANLPIPSMQLPSLLIEPTVLETIPMDCAESVAADEQSPVINQAMATLVLEFMYRLLKGTLTWMGAYIDLETGTRQVVPATPETIARMCGVKVDSLMFNPCSIGHRYAISGLRLP